jgi:hypothetical protein
MPQVQNWIKIRALLAFSFATLCYAVLGIYVLAEDKTIKAGIATLIVHTCPSCNIFYFTNKLLTQFNFNLTNIHLLNPLVKPHAILASGPLQLFQSEIQSAASLLSTANSGAIGATAIAVSNITAIKAIISRNCSLSTKQFYIRSENKINCTDFPFNISCIILEAITKFTSNKI